MCAYIGVEPFYCMHVKYLTYRVLIFSGASELQILIANCKALSIPDFGYKSRYIFMSFLLNLFIMSVHVWVKLICKAEKKINCHLTT